MKNNTPKIKEMIMGKNIHYYGTYCIVEQEGPKYLGNTCMRAINEKGKVDKNGKGCKYTALSDGYCVLRSVDGKRMLFKDGKEVSKGHYNIKVNEFGDVVTLKDGKILESIRGDELDRFRNVEDDGSSIVKKGGMDGLQDPQTGEIILLGRIITGNATMCVAIQLDNSCGVYVHGEMIESISRGWATPLEKGRYIKYTKHIIDGRTTEKATLCQVEGIDLGNDEVYNGGTARNILDNQYEQITSKKYHHSTPQETVELY